MVDSLQSLTKIRDTLFKSDSPTLNNALPVTLEVLEKTSATKYMLKIGNLMMETKSLKELQIGGKYFAELQKSSVGTILIQNLTKQPKLLDELKNAPLKFDDKALKKVFGEGKNPINELKNMILEQMATTTNKDDFTFLSNMLLSIQKEVLTLPLEYDGKNGFLQTKKAKKGRYDQNFVEFYAAFPHLGALSGKITMQKEELELYILTQYASTKSLLESELGELMGFAKVNIGVQKEIEPFYEFSMSLLDLRG